MSMQEIQRSEEWLKLRASRVGATDIAPIIGISPYKTRLELFREKTGQVAPKDISNLPHVKRGIDAEPAARELMERTLGVKYTAPVVIHKDHPWAVASLDGLCPDHVLEIKCMGKANHELTKQGMQMQQEGDMERGTIFIPKYYEVQMQWQMFISGIHLGLFNSFRPEDRSSHYIWIKYDEARSGWMFEEAQRFMEEVIEYKKRPQLW